MSDLGLPQPILMGAGEDPTSVVALICNVYGGLGLILGERHIR